MPELVSIYLPTHNRVDMLRAATASVLGQTHENLELIVVDDGSTDTTPAFLAELALVDRRVRTFRNDTALGACHARNRAIRAATGKFIMGLDDDDEYMPTLIEDVLSFWKLLQLRGQRVSGIYVQDLHRGRDMVQGKKAGSTEAEDLFTGNSIGNQLFSLRERYLEIGLFNPDLPAWQDLEFMMRMVKHFGPARLLDMPLYVFDVSDRDDRISAQSKLKILEAFKIVFELHGEGIARRKQKMLLQVFSKYYDFSLNFRDCLAFARLGFWPGGYATMGARLLGKNHWL